LPAVILSPAAPIDFADALHHARTFGSAFAGTRSPDELPGASFP